MLELSVVLAVLGLLAAIWVPRWGERWEAARREAEDRTLAALALELQASFADLDPARNVADFVGERVGRTELGPTEFDGELGEGPWTVRAASWVAKLGRRQGHRIPEGQALNPTERSGLAAVAFNATGRRRWLVASPPETHQQRYLLLSLLAPEERQLYVPANDGTASWFDAVWNHDWSASSNALPEGWVERLLPQDASAWLTGWGEGTRLQCLRVQRIVQPRHLVILNNSHPTTSAWVDLGAQADWLVSLPQAGVTTGPAVLAGRQVVVRRGLTAPGTEVCRFFLHEPTSLTVQP